MRPAGFPQLQPILSYFCHCSIHDFLTFSSSKYRLHQFDKVEIVRIEKPENSYAALDEMIAHVEKLVQDLGLRYRILRLCGGDMSFTSAITYDFELWSAAQGRWLEISSVSNFESYQANRLKCRYKDENGKTQLVHTLNGMGQTISTVRRLREISNAFSGIAVRERDLSVISTEVFIWF